MTSRAALGLLLVAGCGGGSDAAEGGAGTALPGAADSGAPPAADAAAPPPGALDVRMAGAVGDGVADDTAALARAAATSNALFFPAGVYLVSQLALRADTRVDAAPSAVLRGKSATAGAVLVLTARDRVTGLGVDGNKGARPNGGSCVEVHGGPGVSLTRVNVHDCADKGVTFANSQGFVVEGSRFDRCVDACVDLAFSGGGRVSDNQVDGCKHGIQWWGGDSALADVPGLSDVTITGNTVSNVAGGCIWGSLGVRVTVTNNHVDGCGDVGIDFEGTSDSTITGNTVKNAINGGITTFYGSHAVTITSNTVEQRADQPGVKFFGTKSSSTLLVDKNTIHTVSGAGITMDQGVVASLTVSNNTIVVDQAAFAIRTLDAARVSITHNQITVGGPTGISFEGPSQSLIADNTVHTTADATSTPGDRGGIFLPWRSAAFPTKSNDIHGNVVSGFFTSINDDCWGDLASANRISQNRVDGKIYRRAGAGWNGQVIANTAISDGSIQIPVDTY